MRLLIYFIAFTLLCFSLPVKSQDLSFSGAPSLALGGIKSVETNYLAALTNPAGLTRVQSPGLAFTYTNPYNIHSLNNQAVAAVVPSQWGHLSLLYARSGYQLSRYNRYGLAYSRMFGEKVAAAFQYNVMSHFMQYSETFLGFFSTVGVQFYPGKAINIGLFIQNLEQSEISYPEHTDLLPVIYAVGLEWKPLNTVSMLLELEKDQEYQPLYKFGLELHPVDLIKLRGGLKSYPVELSFGVGIKWKFVEVDIGLSHHQQLGITPGASCSFSWQKSKLNPD